MSTISDSTLPTPKSWQALEDICLSSFSLRWSNPNLCKHGRQGQEQDGVDIYGDDDKSQPVGIQCKNTLKRITKKLIQDELVKAEKFKPTLTALFIATTAPADAVIQKYVRELNKSRKLLKKFPVHVVFWEAIQHDLCRDLNAVRQHYPELTGNMKLSKDRQKRDKDIKKLTELLKMVDLSKAFNSIGFDAKYIPNCLIEEREKLFDFKSNNPNAFYDDKITKEIDSLYDDWNKLLKKIISAPYDEDPRPGKEAAKFVQENPSSLTSEEKFFFNEVTKELNNFKLSINNFRFFLKNEYIEIDID